jgi:hypothetical protein
VAVRALIRLIVSIVGALFPLLFLSGSFSPLGSYLPNILGKESGLYNSFQSSLGASLPIGVLPFGAAGITGLAVYSVFQRVLGSIQTATYSRPKIDRSQIMKSLQSQMPGMNYQSMPRSIPQDMSRSQYLILATYRNGENKAKNVAKALSMDRKAVEEQTTSLQRNGYLTKDNKLTAKGLDIL